MLVLVSSRLLRASSPVHTVVFISLGVTTTVYHHYLAHPRVARAVIATLALALLASWPRTSVVSSTGNLLVNPGFETDVNGDNQPDSWTSSAYLTRSNSVVHGDSYAGRWQSTKNSRSASYQQVGVTPGTTYDFSGWVNAPATVDSFTFQLKMQWRSASGAISTTVIKKFTDDTAGTWQQVTGSAIAPPTATLGRVQMTTGSLATSIYVDDLLLAAVAGESPSPTPTPAPTPGTTDPVLVAAGDIACPAGLVQTAAECRHAETAKLLADSDAVVTLGDNQYDNGELANFAASFDLTWGTARGRMHPVPGNHEYGTGNAQGYRDYFGYASTQPLYYSWDIGTWHIVALDSEASANAGSIQEQWLRADLAAHPNTCTLAYWHKPLFSSGDHGGNTAYRALWIDLYEAGADIILNGHDHDYERFAPQDPYGTPDPLLGIREFVVGTGGMNLRTTGAPQPNSEVRDDANFGVLRLGLHATGYEWRFLPEAGSTFSDVGTGSCSFTKTDFAAPSAPTGVAATALDSTSVGLTWTSSTDDMAVTGYEIYRDGVPLTSVRAVTAYTDTTVFPGSTFSYTVRARDAEGNRSAFSEPASVTTPASPAPPFFTDDFESGSLTGWTSINGLVVQQAEVHGGSWAGRATNDGAAVAAFAYTQLPQAQYELFSRIRFKVVSQGGNAVNLLRLRGATGTSIVNLYRGSTGKLTLGNQVSSVTKASATVVSVGVWHEAQLRVRINGTSSESEVWLDGVRINDLSLMQALGMTPVGRVNVGENVAGRTYDVAFDDIALGPSYVTP